MLKILVADSTKELCAAITERFAGRYAVSVCHDGKTALDKLRILQPDILWLDLILPGMDGITILQAASMAGICPKVLVTSSYINDQIQADLSRLGVCYLMTKPCSISAVLSGIERVAQSVQQEAQEREKSPEDWVYECLLFHGVTGARKGNKRLLEAVLMKVLDEEHQVTKTIYPELAKRHGGSTDSIEKAISRVISDAWKTRDPQIWPLLFPEYVGKAPSNGVFIDRMAAHIRERILQSRSMAVSAENTNQILQEIPSESCQK